MSIGLAVNQRDKDMVDLCAKNTKGAWTGVWAAVLCDGIEDAVAEESELRAINQHGYNAANVGDEVVEVVIVTRAEWERLMERAGVDQ